MKIRARNFEFDQFLSKFCPILHTNSLEIWKHGGATKKGGGAMAPPAPLLKTSLHHMSCLVISI